MPETSMQLLDRDRHFAGKSWKPGHETMEGETGTHHNELSKSGKREGGRGGEWLNTCSHAKQHSLQTLKL